MSGPRIADATNATKNVSTTPQVLLHAGAMNTPGPTTKMVHATETTHFAYLEQQNWSNKPRPFAGSLQKLNVPERLNATANATKAVIKMLTRKISQRPNMVVQY